jgi:predicted Zn-dependent peptidase
MSPRALAAALGAALLAAPAPAGSLAAEPPKPAAGSVRVSLPYRRVTLDNGLEVVLHVDRRTPIVAVNLWYHVGSKDEAPGKNGFAHLFEHVMFQGSKHVGEDMYFKYLERAGASDRNGTTSTDRTNYFETVPGNQLELVLWLESDRMGFLLDHADQATFESQREVVKNERRQRYENAPYGFVPKLVNEALYPPGHPYHLLTIGTPEDLDRASLDDVRAFFRTYYVPNNATLVIAGDLDEARALELVKKYFGPIPRGAAPPVRTQPVPVALDREVRLDVEADVELARVSMTWPTPPIFAAGDGELDLAANLLASGKSSLLYKRLVYDLQIAQDVSASQRSAQLASSFEIAVTLKKGQKPEQVIALVDEELEGLRKGGPAPAELERARAQILSGLVFGLESVTGRANALNSYNQLAGDPGRFDEDVARYERAAPADVQAAAAKHLPRDRRVLTIVTPTPGAPRAGRLARSH